jgi:hypothetical protein
MPRNPVLCADSTCNAWRWPATLIANRGASPRQPSHSVLRKTIWYHESVTDLSCFRDIPDAVTLKRCETVRTAARR